MALLILWNTIQIKIYSTCRLFSAENSFINSFFLLYLKTGKTFIVKHWTKVIILTLFQLRGVTVTLLPVDHWPEVVQICWLFLLVNASNFRLKAGLLYLLPESSGILPYIYENINLNLDLLPVIGFQHLIALYNTMKQIAQFLQSN